MNNYAFTQFILQTFAITITTYLLPGLHIKDLLTVVVTGFVVSFINFFIKPIAHFFSLPITILTFGLFYLVVNAGLMLLASVIVPGFVIDSFWWAMSAAIIFSCVMMFLNLIFGGKYDY